MLTLFRGPQEFLSNSQAPEVRGTTLSGLIDEQLIWRSMWVWVGKLSRKLSRQWFHPENLSQNSRGLEKNFIHPKTFQER